MQIGIVGLGRMGGNIARRLLAHGHSVVVFDKDAAIGKTIPGASVAVDFKDMAGKLAHPRHAWIMLPAGSITDEAVAMLASHFEAGDAIVDGGNSFYRDDIRRAKELSKRGIHYVDSGTSGGIWGYERGYCLMIGGDKAIVDRLDPIFSALAPGQGEVPKTPGRAGRDPRVERGYLHAGPAGAGHFVKMVHNGIEYGLMQAYAEGFDVLRGRGDASVPPDERFALDVADIAEVWRRGSVVSSWLLDLTAAALAEDPDLSGFEGAVEDSGEGRWTVEAAVEEGVPAPVLSAALFARFRSRMSHSFGEKLLSAMRKKFGGHVEQPRAVAKP